MPESIVAHRETLEMIGVYGRMFYECEQEERLRYIRECINNNNDHYKHMIWDEPWLPQCTFLFYKQGSVSITGPRTREMAVNAAHLLVYYLNYYFGIPANVHELTFDNIACDTRLNFPLDLEKLHKKLGSLVRQSRKFPAAIIFNPFAPNMKTLAYPTGNIVETGGKVDHIIIENHKRMVDIARQCRLDSETVGSVADRQRRKMASQRRQKSESSIKDANDIIRAILTNNFDFMDNKSTTESLEYQQPQPNVEPPLRAIETDEPAQPPPSDRAQHKRQLDWFDNSEPIVKSSKRRKISSSNMASFLFDEEEEEEAQELLRSKYTNKSKILHDMGATNETAD